jgi:signal transduction histidine kinase
VPNNQTKTDATGMFVRAAALLFLIATEFVAARFLKISQAFVDVYIMGVVVTMVCFGLLWLLGGKPVLKDLREIYFYDVLVQIGALLFVKTAADVDVFLTLANAVALLKLVRLLWPARRTDGLLISQWPRFGFLGFFGGQRDGTGLTQNQVNAVYLACVLCLPAGYIFHHGLREDGMLVFFCITLLLVVTLTKRIAARIDYTEGETARIAAEELAVAQERARVAAERAEQAAQLAQLNYELELTNHKMNLTNQALAESNEQLQESNLAIARANAALERHEQFVLQANHDIMPLLNFMHDFARLALDSSTSEPQRKLIGEIITLNTKTADRLSCLLGIRRATVHREQSIFASVALNAVLEDVEMPFIQMAQNRGSVFALKGDFYFNVWSNEEYLERIISNLIKNALIHNPPGTEVHVLVTPGRKGGCRIRILDTGPGIPEAAGPDGKQNFLDLLARSQQNNSGATSRAALAATTGTASHGIGLQSVAALCQELGIVMHLYRRGCFGTIFMFMLEMAAQGYERPNLQQE